MVFEDDKGTFFAWIFFPFLFLRRSNKAWPRGERVGEHSSLVHKSFKEQRLGTSILSFLGTTWVQLLDCQIVLLECTYSKLTFPSKRKKFFFLSFLLFLFFLFFSALLSFLLSFTKNVETLSIIIFVLSLDILSIDYVTEKKSRSQSSYHRCRRRRRRQPFEPFSLLA